MAVGPGGQNWSRGLFMAVEAAGHPLTRISSLLAWNSGHGVTVPSFELSGVLWAEMYPLHIHMVKS